MSLINQIIFYQFGVTIEKSNFLKAENVLPIFFFARQK